MVDESVSGRLKEIFSVVLEIPVDDIRPELSPDSSEKWDSLRHIHLVSAIDEGFGISLTFEQQMEALTFDLALEVVTESLGAKSRT